MKQLFLIATICLLLCMFSTAQYSKFGFTAGSVFANYKTKYNLIETSSKTKAGITIGALADFPMGEKTSFQTNLNFVFATGGLGPLRGRAASCTPWGILYWLGGSVKLSFGGLPL